MFWLEAMFLIKDQRLFALDYGNLDNKKIKKTSFILKVPTRVSVESTPLYANLLYGFYRL